MDILQVLTSEGYQFKKVTAKEYAGLCPFCGGDDRFHVWPEKNRYWCRGCNRKGDVIQYYRDKHGLSYVDACKRAGTEPRQSSRFLPVKNFSLTWEPREVTPPPLKWQDQAAIFWEKSINELWSESRIKVIEYLESRGIKRDTILKARLGFNFIDRYFNPKLWDVESDKKVWIPEGIVIPYIRGDHIWRLRVRTDNPNYRYVVVRGGKAKPMILDGKPETWVITESELDGILIHQEAGDIVSTLALGSAQIEPDREAHKALKRARRILINLDYDAAGAKRAQWWKNTYPQAQRWPPPEGKDAGEYFQLKGDIREWIEAGL